MRLSIYNKLTNASEVRDVPGDEVSIGSDPANAVALEQSTLSPRHARIVIQNGQVIVEDLQSTRGTFIGLDRVREPTAVRPGESRASGGPGAARRRSGLR